MLRICGIRLENAPKVSDTYRAMRVREMWLVDPENRQAEVRSFEAGKTTVYTVGDILQSEVLTLVQIPVASLFPAP